jgi:ribosomal protein L11 methyltransferase
MHVLEVLCAPADCDFVIADMYDRGATGIVSEDLPGGPTTVRGYFNFRIETDVFAGREMRWLPLDPTDWEAVARAQWDTLEVGERFFLVPDWRDDPAPPGRLRLVMRPGMACGTGWGPATHLLLELMETTVRPGIAVLDIGTGSGILCSAAHLLGAERIVACDIDPDVTAIAAARVRIEKISALVFTGSVRSVRADSIDVALANLNAATLVDLAPEIERVLKPGGVVLAGGFHKRELDRVREAYKCRAEPRVKEDWLALVCPRVA